MTPTLLGRAIDGQKLVRHPDCDPDLAEFTRDLAPGRAGILTDIHLTEEAKHHNAVGVGGMRRQAHTVALGWVGSGRISQVSPTSVVRSTCPFSPVVVSPHPANSTPGSSALTMMPRA